MRERGNALFLILIAVALFAALSYAVTKSTRGSGSTTKEQAQIKAAQLISYMGTLQSAVTRMVLAGIDPTALQFTTTPLSGVPCTTGDTCVFAPEGGGVSFLPWSSFFTAAPSGFGYWKAGAGAIVSGVGTSSDEVLVEITGGAAHVVDELCAIVNQRLGLPAASAQPNNQAFDPNTPPFTFNAMPGVAGGCGREDSGSSYYFYWVLYAR